jgi:hypothetical protein
MWAERLTGDAKWLAGTANSWGGTDDAVRAVDPGADRRLDALTDVQRRV